MKPLLEVRGMLQISDEAHRTALQFRLHGPVWVQGLCNIPWDLLGSRGFLQWRHWNSAFEMRQWNGAFERRSLGQGTRA